MTTTAAPGDGQKSTSRAVTVTWIALCAITVGSWWLAPGHGSGTALPSVGITTVVVVLGIIKVRLVIRHFMAVKTAPRWLKLSTDAWLVALWAAILAIYLY
ncbi:MAG: cytochrome C oxidase subunit IV family protein [Mycobacterium sp.]